MTTAHDERFNTPPAMEDADPSLYPEGLKPGDEGFLEALAKKSGFKLVDNTKKKDLN